MTETALEAQNATESPEEAPQAIDTHEATPEPQEGSEGFSREYVSKLREESKQRREEAQDAQKRADWLQGEVRRLATREATRGILADPEGLPWSDEYIGEDGLPDQAKISKAADDLVRVKPWLGRVRGDVGQGQHSAGEDRFSLMELLRP